MKIAATQGSAAPTGFRSTWRAPYWRWPPITSLVKDMAWDTLSYHIYAGFNARQRPFRSGLFCSRAGVLLQSVYLRAILLSHHDRFVVARDQFHPRDSA